MAFLALPLRSDFGAPSARAALPRSRCGLRAQRKPVSFSKKDAASKGQEEEELEGPRPLPDAQLEVAVVGGGLVGLACALVTSLTTQGKKRIRVYDRRWRDRKDRVEWQQEGRRCGVVNLQSNTWSQLPSELQEQLFVEGGFCEQWPRQRESSAEGYPRNLDLQHMEDTLLRMAQESDQRASVELCVLPEGVGELQSLLASDPCHALVLADGPDALEFRDQALLDSFPPGLGSRELSLPESLALGFELESEAVDLAAAATLSTAQRRFLLNAATPQKGVMSMVLADSETGSLEPSGAQEVEKLRDSELWSEVQKGFKLFGLPESAATTAARWRPDLQGRSNYFAEVESLVAPELSALCVAHPWAFAVGEAAGLSNPWPGRGHNAALRSALALSLHLRATAQAIRAGYPVDNAFFREFGERMSRIHSQEEGTHRRQCQAAQTASKSWSLGTCIDEAKQDEERGSRASLEGSFLQTVKKSWKRLCEVQPIEVDSQPLDAEALCDRIRGLQLEESTLKLFRASGAWFFEPPTATERPGQRSKEAATAPEEEDEEKLLELEAKSRSDYNLGVRLLKGKGVEKDEVEAARCFREAADLGHLKASYALGVMLLNGQGVGKDEVLAGAYLKQAAQAGDPKAMYNLSLMYQNAIGVKRDLDVAKEWMEQAAKRGHKKALRSKSIKVFGAGPWMDYDPDEMGVDRIVKEAEAGNTHAQFRLGSMYYEGEKFAADKAQASYWFMQAAQAGLPEAQYQISRMLFLGDGVEADAEYAMRFLKSAAERGHVESMHNLGVKLYFGDGIGNDRRTAASWFLKASEQGFPQSQNNLGWMLYCGDGVPINTQEGLKWMEKAASAGNQEAQYHLLSVRGTMISGD